MLTYASCIVQYMYPLTLQELRVKLDIEEAKLQAKKRKEALDRAKTLQYYQTDRVKEFHVGFIFVHLKILFLRYCVIIFHTVCS